MNLTESSRFEAAVLFSLLLHVLLWQGLSWQDRWKAARDAEISPLEIDLTRPFRLTSNPLLARKADNPGTGAPIVKFPSTAEKPAMPNATTALGDKPTTEPPKDWILPGPSTQILEKPGNEDGGLSSGLGGLGDGTGTGEVDWIYLTDLPKILNRDDLAKYLRKFYPEAERRAGREGAVGLDIHLDAAGKIVKVDIVQSDGASFDEAARKVIAEARFAPAKVKTRAVAVKIRQTITFRLED